jgi:pyridoxal phosphate enzyme (YggS family)
MKSGIVVITMSCMRLGTTLNTAARRKPSLQLRRSFSATSSDASCNDQASADIQTALLSVKDRIKVASKTRPKNGDLPAVCLVAVSKTKPASALHAAYLAGQRDFGENYIQELVEKAGHPTLSSLKDLNYHFVGKIQSNKVNMLIKKVPQLGVVETIDSAKLATKINGAVKAAVAEGLRPPGSLKVMIQVNSSGEPQKGGVESSSEAVALAQEIVGSCSHLALTGVMTIGNADYTAGPDNFAFLATCRKEVAQALGIEENALELSMGMSGDFEAAIAHGSTNVRVGSTIFGSRVYDK